MIAISPGLSRKMSYENLPVKQNDNPIALYELEQNKLPENYDLFVDEAEEIIHIAHSSSVEVTGGGLFFKGESICEITVRELYQSDPILGNCCGICLDRMNSIMEDYMYDETGEEYYDPIQEREGSLGGNIICGVCGVPADKGNLHGECGYCNSSDRWVQDCEILTKEEVKEKLAD